MEPSNAPRFRYRKDGEDEIDGTTVWRIKYEETKKPTIIRTSAGKDMPAKGTFWIDRLSGGVFKSHMELTAEATMGRSMPRLGDPVDPMRNPSARPVDPTSQRVQSSASITVRYRRDAQLGLLLPSEMLETYEGPSVNRFTGEEESSRVNCRATYSDFKQFQTSGRVITPK